MAASTFVGAGPAVYDPSAGWPTSLNIADATPENVQNGDRVILAVIMFSDQSVAGLNCPTPTGWTSVISRNLYSRSSLGLWVFTARWDGSTGSATVAPTFTASSAANVWRMQAAAWRPSKAVGQSATGDGNRIATPFYSAIASQYGTNSSTRVLLQCAEFQDLTGTSSEFTVRLDQASIANRLGGFRIGDQIISTNVSTGSGPAWTTQLQSSTYPLSITCHLFLDAPSDDPAVGADWSIGRIAY
jgi:hypothetical protein